MNQSNVLPDSVEDLVDAALQEIILPLDQIPSTPLRPTPLGSEHHSEGEHFGYDSDDIMDGNQNVFPAWMPQGALNLPELMHEMPKHLERLLLKFDLDKACSP